MQKELVSIENGNQDLSKVFHVHEQFGPAFRFMQLHYEGDLNTVNGMGHEAQYLASLRITKGLLDVKRKFKWGNETLEQFIMALNITVPITLHLMAFLPVLRTQMDEDQQKMYLQDAEEFRIIGCYAQTELAHGSNFRELQTTATFNVEKQKFVLHTASVEGTKWWAGGLGRTATHAIVFARLIITKGEQSADKGVHPFMVQIRDLKTLKAIPGMNMGDIGPKYGYNMLDNGYLSFDHAEIPRRALLGKTGSVSIDGEYKPPLKKNIKVMYSSMTHIRTHLVQATAYTMARAMTIAIRYLAVRRQFSNEPGGIENSVLDYRMVQHRVLPHLAAAVALLFASRDIVDSYNQVTAKGFDQSSKLAELHALSCGLKALSTSMAAKGVESSRRACGGHGYSSLSGLPHIAADLIGACTLEGENFLMVIQTTQYLLKSYQKLQNGDDVDDRVRYLGVCGQGAQIPCKASSVDDMQTQHVILQALQCRSGYLLYTLFHKLQEYLLQGKSLSIAFNILGKLVVQVGHAHCEYIIYQSMLNRIQLHHAKLQGTLQVLATTFGLFVMEENLSVFMECHHFSPLQAKWVHESLGLILPRLRQQAIAITDAFCFPAISLRSSIDNDNVYHQLYHAATSTSLNDEVLDAPIRSKVWSILQHAKL